jgi:Proliferating cell nuclear antigen, N-terminal domain
MSTPKKTAVKKPAAKSGRGPGRPRKNKETHKLPKLGVVDEPTNVEIYDPNDPEKDLTKKNKIPNPDPRTIYVMEMIYDNPDMWKKIFTVLTNLSVSTVRIQFNLDGITIIAMDHNQKCEIYVEIFGKELSRYYCEESFEISVNQENMKKIVSTIKTTHVSIAFTANTDIKCKKFRTILHHKTAKMETWQTYNLDCEQAKTYKGTIFEDLKCEDEYPLEFTFESKYWKTCVGDWMKLADVIKIEIEPPCPLTFKHTFDDKKGNQVMDVVETDYMNLKCEIEEGDVFAVSILLDNIKAIANSNAADDITISAHEDKKIIFTALLDQDIDEKTRKPKLGTETCKIKILTEIVNLREEKKEEDD